MELESTFGARLRELMEERGDTYEQLGERLHMTPQTLNRYVLGRREPKVSTATAIAMTLGVDPLWLQGYSVPRRRGAPEEAAWGTREHTIPILGVIRAGAPILAVEDIEGYAAADVAQPEEYFYLRVTGDSMINAGIRDGDLVLLRRQRRILYLLILDRKGAVAGVVTAPFVIVRQGRTYAASNREGRRRLWES